MGYYTRVLTTTKDCVPVSELTRSLRSKGLSASLEVDGEQDDWASITLVGKDGKEIAAIERNIVEQDSLGDGELSDFESELEEAHPKNAAEWLASFFKRVQCIYAFQHLSGANDESGFAALTTIRDRIWNAAPAIIQADGEGFTNEAGYHILWQFSESVSGSWWMGVLQSGEWVHFQMDLGDPSHRRAFMAGEIPSGATLA